MKRFIYKITHPFIKFYWKIFKPKTFGSRAIVICNRNILLVKNININYWSLPGGKIDKGETPENCVLRELKEELDLNGVEIDYKLGQYVSKKEGKSDTIYIFVIKVKDFVFKKQWELEDAKWFSLDNLPENISPAGFLRIKEYISGKINIFSNW